MVAAVSATPNPKPSTHQNWRPPLLPSEGDNGAVPRRPRAREVSSRYMSPSTSSSSSSSSSSGNSFASKRSAAPLVSRPGTPTPARTPMPGASTVKRAQSVERRRSATPWATTVDSRAAGDAPPSAASKMLFTATRSLSVSFQGESFALQVSKAKPAPSPNVRKGTPERRKPTPVRGGRRGDGGDQMENSKPSDQHRWPARLRQGNFMTRSTDFTDERKRVGGSRDVAKTLHYSVMTDTPKHSIGRLEAKLSTGEFGKPAPAPVGSDSARGSVEASDPNASDSDSVSSGSTSGVQENGSVARVVRRGIMVPARVWQETDNRLRRLPDPGSPTLKTRGLSSPVRGPARPASPSPRSPMKRTPSPSRARTPAVSTSTNSLSSITTPSILNFAADARRGRIGESRINDAYLLRILHNRQLQWRFVNARADASVLANSLTAEKCLYNASITTSKLRDSVRGKRKELQFLRQSMKLTSILKGQMLYLDEWALLERDHTSSLSGAIKALEASTLRLPVVGTKADIQTLKEAVCSGVDVMQAMASSICLLLSKVEKMNSFVAELASITNQEHTLLDQCVDILSALTAMQVSESSLRTHTLQQNRLPQI